MGCNNKVIIISTFLVAVILGSNATCVKELFKICTCWPEIFFNVSCRSSFDIVVIVILRSNHCKTLYHFMYVLCLFM